jgi:hypothetical protein
MPKVVCVVEHEREEKESTDTLVGISVESVETLQLSMSAVWHCSRPAQYLSKQVPEYCPEYHQDDCMGEVWVVSCFQGKA